MDLGNVITVIVTVFGMGVVWGALKASIGKIPEQIQHSQAEMILALERAITKLKEDLDKRIDVIEKRVDRHEFILQKYTEHKTGGMDQR